MLAGSAGRVLWKLFVLVVGGFAIYYATAVTSSFIVTAVVGIIVTLALSRTVREAAMDVWYMNFMRL